MNISEIESTIKDLKIQIANAGGYSQVEARASFYVALSNLTLALQNAQREAIK